MTDQELRFRELQETRRHNQAMEQLQGDTLVETHRTNVENEGIKKESNVITNAHYIRSDAENVRHNTATEDIQRTGVEENIRHNKEDERIQDARNAEVRRHNIADERIQSVRNTENIRHNQVTEAISAYNLGREGQLLDEKIRTQQEDTRLTHEQSRKQAMENKKFQDTAPSDVAATVQENKLRLVTAANERQSADVGYQTGLNYDIGWTSQIGKIGRNIADTVSPVTNIIKSATDIAKAVTNVRK